MLCFNFVLNWTDLLRLWKTAMLRYYVSFNFGRAIIFYFTSTLTAKYFFGKHRISHWTQWGQRSLDIMKTFSVVFLISRQVLKTIPMSPWHLYPLLARQGGFFLMMMKGFLSSFPSSNSERACCCLRFCFSSEGIHALTCFKIADSRTIIALLPCSCSI